ncbi:MAG: SOS response-associated peptidase [Anaerolineales bacterium]
MCGRFTLTADTAALQATFPQVDFSTVPGVRPRYNIAPGQAVLGVPNVQPWALDAFIWGLVPSWAREQNTRYRLINARAESLHQKAAYRAPLRYRRGLILADGFYEWRALPGEKRKTPYYIRLRDGKPFAFAALWDVWQAPDGSELRTASIVTTAPNALIAPIHDRMPVILPPALWARWLTPQATTYDTVADLLTPYPTAEMEAWPVSQAVNNPAFDAAECIHKV